MKNLWVRSTQALSRALDSAERETVLGDLAELGMSDRQAFKGVLGLVLRRQLGLWKKWQPWFVLLAVVAPVGPLLATQSDRLELMFLPNLEMWLHYGISYRTGVSSTALFAEFCFRACALVTWSWTSAVALGALSRKTIWANGVLFFLLCALFTVDRGFYSIRLLWTAPWAWTPTVSNFLFVLLPLCWGLRVGTQSAPITFPRLILLAVWTGIIGGLAFWTEGWYGAALDNWSHAAPAMSLPQLAQRADLWISLFTHSFTLAVLTGPILYLLAMDRFSHRRSRMFRA